MGLFRVFLFILKASVTQHRWCCQAALQLAHMRDSGLVIIQAGSHVDAGVSGQINRVELLVIAKSGAFVLKEVVSE